MNAHLHETPNKALKVINFIKARPLNSRLLKLLCEEMGLGHQHLLLHTEARLMSLGMILSRLFKLQQEVRMFFLDQKSTANEAVKVINFTKARPLNSRLFKLLCEEMGSGHQHMLLHTEARLMSFGIILSRLF